MMAVILPRGTLILIWSKKEYARKARFGYVNGREPVNYVRDIRQRFEAYVELSREPVQARSEPGQFAAPGLIAETLPRRSENVPFLLRRRS